jgi:high-affinity nickel permease
MESTALATLFVGFALGLRHSTDADHIAAVSTLVSESTDARHGMRVGAWWGLGHLLTIFLLGSILIALRVELSARVEWALELLVAFVLIALGVRTILLCFRGRYHFHRHSHGQREHSHLHFHAKSEAGHRHDAHAMAAAPRPVGRGVRSLLVGMIHGLAGTAGLALLVLGSIPSPVLGVSYLMVFGLGALLGMVVFSAILGVPFRRAAGRLKWLFRLRLAAGTASAALGAFLVWSAFRPGEFPF